MIVTKGGTRLLMAATNISQKDLSELAGLDRVCVNRCVSVKNSNPPKLGFTVLHKVYANMKVASAQDELLQQFRDIDKLPIVIYIHKSEYSEFMPTEAKYIPHVNGYLNSLFHAMKDYAAYKVMSIETLINRVAIFDQKSFDAWSANNESAKNTPLWHKIWAQEIGLKQQSKDYGE